MWSFAAPVAAIITAPAHAQSREPTAPEIAAIRDCVTKSKDDVDAGEQQCLFKLVMADCYRIDKNWDTLLYDNCKSLLDELASEQTAKARARQRVDRLSGHDLRFYDDKIRGYERLHCG